MDIANAGVFFNVKFVSNVDVDYQWARTSAFSYARDEETGTCIAKVPG